MHEKTRKEPHGTGKLSPQSRFFLQKACRFAVNVRLSAGHFVNVLFLFIQIVALLVSFLTSFFAEDPIFAEASIRRHALVAVS